MNPTIMMWELRYYNLTTSPTDLITNLGSGYLRNEVDSENNQALSDICENLIKQKMIHKISPRRWDFDVDDGLLKIVIKWRGKKLD